jgi:subtilisin family serine protease
VHYPAALLQPVGSAGRDGAGLSVAASTIAGTRAAFSNTGTHVSLSAPGEDVLGAISSLSSSNDYPRIPLAGAQTGLYGYGSGTSFAAPQVAGAAALVWAANPALSAQQVAEILERTASGRGSWNSRLGYGVIDLAAAVARATGAPHLRLTGERERRRVHLAWRGAEGSLYRLTVGVDGRPARIAVDRTERSSASFRGAPGHTYAFAVTALDETGAAVVSSNTLSVSFAGR